MKKPKSSILKGNFELCGSFVKPLCPFNWYVKGALCRRPDEITYILRRQNNNNVKILPRNKVCLSMSHLRI